jgi:urate oxidase
MKIGGSGLTRFAFGAKKSSLAATARPPSREDARSASVVKEGLVCSGMLTHTAYGKSDVRLVQVLRAKDRDDLRDVTVSIRFEGEYDASYVDGDNREVLPTDTMKNTVYALAAERAVRDIEAFGVRLGRHFVDRNPRLQRATIQLVEHLWQRIQIGERGHEHAFMRRGPDRRTAAITVTRDRASVSAGIADLLIMKTAASAFDNFMRDEFTTLPDTRDRLLATSLTATWNYAHPDVPFGPTWCVIRDTLLRVFAEHRSESVQHTLYAMAQQVIDDVDVVESITLVMPNKHHLPVDVSRLGFENRNEIFVATDEPYGRIEATVSR